MTLEIGSGSVLVVDDDYDIRASLIEVLGSEGYTVVGAGNGLEALKQLQRSVPALILLDIMMPLMNGIQFRNEQVRNPPWAKVPVIVMTARSREELALQGMSLEGIGYLRKPVDLRTLLGLVERSMPRS